ncbi:alpha/beta fold hydrolase [Mycolicibacterium moriokaense]|uniref:Pimeloyl-ACP methyl ester carboxylesterase n=1 Tax=Mycolicibacterium moriokaense TaxID=39691 RepID=A0A318HK37_9MYCO|nr:alpha/beta fold hydrolase [Mycolicibacterium moriokaense]PXX02306.1 pimeloyl-ACP methyl ester carboxylesterase [Mycolicibacterium moriokaense]
MVNSCFTDNGDARIHYLDSGGDDRGAPIVFVPGMTDIADDYVEVMPIFGRRTLVVELRGHGKSGAPVSGYDLTTLSGDVGAVVDAVTDGPIHMVTFSRGTSYAVAWALAQPDRVLSLAIGDYTPEERALPPAVSHRVLTGRWRGSPVHERLNIDAANKTFQAADARSFWEALSPLKIPLLVVRSGDSVLVGDVEWARYRQLFPGAELVDFPDSPHDIFRPDRGRYPQLVREHIERAEVRGPAPRRQQ